MKRSHKIFQMDIAIVAILNGGFIAIGSVLGKPDDFSGF